MVLQILVMVILWQLNIKVRKNIFILMEQVMDGAIFGKLHNKKLLVAQKVYGKLFIKEETIINSSIRNGLMHI